MKKCYFIFTLFIALFILINTSNAQADRLTTAILKLNRMTPNTALTGTVCATPSDGTAGTENKVTVQFPNDFSIDSNQSNWNVNTSDIPDNSVPWPGVGLTAYSITNRTVTFSSSNLTNANNLYCFNFTSNSSQTGNLGNKTGIISTLNSSDQEIDSLSYGLSIVANDQIVITANVNPQASDFDSTIQRIDPPGDGTFRENEELEYEITYGNTLLIPYSFTLEAGWSQGAIENDNNANVNILEYISGSATNGYGNSSAIIDPVNRTISWAINSFPSSSESATVRFKVRTTNNYTGSKKVSFRTSSRILFDDSSSIYSYAYDNFKHTVGPTPTPTPAPPVIPPKKILPKFEKIEIPEIKSTEARAYVQTNIKTVKVIRYGTSIYDLDKRSSTNLNLGTHITLKDLKPNTKYFFRVYATDKNDNQVVSDIYTFKSASSSSPLTANILSLIASSDNTIITSLIPEKNNFLVIPQNSEFQFKFAMLDKTNARLVEANLRNENILGIFDFPGRAQASTDIVSLLEIENGVYFGNLKTSASPGNYGLFLRINDANGNLTEQQIAKIKVVKKFKIISENKKPIEGARVHILAYNPSSKTHKIIPSSSLNEGNPIYSNSNGELNLVLPQGKYKAEISDLKHKDKTVEFEIGPRNGQEYPIVTLENTHISLIGLFNYYRKTTSDVFIYNTQIYSENLTGSTRFFDLVSIISLGIVIALTLFAFSKRHRIPVSYIPSYFYYLIDKKDRNDKYIHGVIYDENDKPISNANVYLTDKEDEAIISSTKTNKYGQFYFRKKQSKKDETQYLLMAMAKNYKNSPLFEYREREHLKFKINLEHQAQGLDFIGKSIHYSEHFIGMSFEVLIIGSFIFELLFLNSFGIAKTLPFLLVSVFNLILWILHSHNKSHSKNIF